MSESWDALSEDLSPTQQALEFEKLINEKLNLFCPVKELKVGSKDKPFINSELKSISRKKNREYLKNGKSERYLRL